MKVPFTALGVQEMNITNHAPLARPASLSRTRAHACPTLPLSQHHIGQIKYNELLMIPLMMSEKSGRVPHVIRDLCPL